jgi:hypothetical protein
MRLLPLPNEPLPNAAALSTMTTRELKRAHIITLSALTDCSDKLEMTVSHLKAHIIEAERIDDERPAPGPDQNIEEEAARLVSEQRSVEQCLAICTEASDKATSDRVHHLEDVNVGENGQQVFVSTLGDLFNLKGVYAGDRSIQFVGSVSDTTLQKYFQYQSNNRASA